MSVVSAAKRVPVVADLALTSLRDLLTGTGFDPGIPSVWIAEGVFIYMDGPSVRRVLREAATLSTPGSWFLADMAEAGSLELETADKTRDLLRDEGIALTFGVQHPARLMSECGWNAAERRLMAVARSLGRIDAALQIGAPGGYLIAAKRRA
jgi:methyltransferase (TIGR00027 family)